MTLRRLGAGDAAAFVALRLKGGRDAADWFRFHPDDEADQPLAATETRLERAYAVGVFEADALVAIGAVEPVPGRKLNHKWLLWGMYVAQGGKGYGQQIVDALVEAAATAGAYSVQLTLVADNHRARALYERCGFRVYGIEPKSVARATGYIDELLMWRPLIEETL